MRILLLTNSYPTAHSPSGAAYITARLNILAIRPDVEVVAVALRPAYSLAGRALRRMTGATRSADLAVAVGGDGSSYLEAYCSWSLLDVLRGRTGRAPVGAIRSAVGSVLALPDIRGVDVVHAHGMYALPAGEVGRQVADSLNVPYVVSAHGSDVAIMGRSRERSVQTVGAAAATTYVSRALRDQAAALGLPAQGALVIPNGYDPSSFYSGDVAPRDRPGVLELLYVGNLLAVKGADRLPNILAAVRQGSPGATLTVVGDGPLRRELQRAMPEARFVGRVPHVDVASLLRSADALLVPSRSEGWGCVVTESYACGTPVVAAAVGGLPEAVGVDSSLVTEGPGFEQRFGETVLSVVNQPPSPDFMQRHLAGATWQDVVRRELDVLRVAVERGAHP